jgi:hypothetical protein
MWFVRVAVVAVVAAALTIWRAKALHSDTFHKKDL